MEHNTREEAHFIKMTETSIPKLIMKLAVPTMISMLVTAIYNMADTYFVSKLGTSATGAVGIVFSLMSIIQAVGFLLGMGAGSQLSRLLGQKRDKEADVLAATGFVMALIFGVILTVAGWFFLTPLMELLGATPTILPYAKDYAVYILIGAPFMCASFVLNNVLRGTGRATMAMIGITFGGVLNIGLDPLFIFVFKMGIAGAAIATVISQAVSFFILLGFFMTRQCSVSIHPRHISRKISVYVTILKTGFPSLCRQGLASIASVALNVNAAVYGDAAVAAMSIVSRIFMLLLSVMIGFGQGFQPVVGFNYGAKRYDRVRSSIKFSIITGIGGMTVLGIVGFILAPNLIRLFQKEDLDVIRIGTLACRAQCLAIILCPVNVICNMLFQCIGKSAQATFLSSARQGIFFLPLIVVLPKLIGLLGVQITQPVSDVLAFLVCIPFIIIFFRELKVLEERQYSIE